MAEFVNTSQPQGMPHQPFSQVNLTNVEITNENVALNVLVGFLGIAQRRGAFAFDEAAKVFECIKLFQKNVNASAPST